MEDIRIINMDRARAIIAKFIHEHPEKKYNITKDPFRLTDDGLEEMITVDFKHCNNSCYVSVYHNSTPNFLDKYYENILKNECMICFDNDVSLFCMCDNCGCVVCIQCMKTGIISFCEEGVCTFSRCPYCRKDKYKP